MSDVSPEDGAPPADALRTDASAEETSGTSSDTGQTVVLPEREDTHALTVVGIGASAGGVRALQDFFESAPTASGSAYVVILHLSPDHESQLAEILGRITAMPVRQVTQQATRLERDHVYVIPPSHSLSMKDGLLELVEPDRTRGRRVVIDLFFRTLAEAHGPQAIAVILSGTGADGTLGLRQIKEAGGLAVAQEPEEAEYDAMPRSAIATGMVDYVLPARAIAGQIAAYWDTSRRMRMPEEAAPSPGQVEEGPDQESALQGILGHLRAQTGHDFGYYRRATVLRRVGRRLQVNGLEDLPTYRDFLRRHPAEVNDLLADLLISVTQFFRDRDAWEALEQNTVPGLFESIRSNSNAGGGSGSGSSSRDDSVRAWVCGCATGEEAYSLAILLAEEAERRNDYSGAGAGAGAGPAFQVFATDMDADALAFARAGLYPDTIVADVSPERLRRWFTPEIGNGNGGRYRIRQELRERVLFAPHDVLRDTPFSRLDLITCRNLLIYLTREAQARVFDLFHFALRPDARLLLGTAESVDGATSLFAAIDKQNRIYVRRPAAARPIPAIPTTVAAAGTIQLPLLLPRPPTFGSGDTLARPASMGDLHQTLLTRYSPPSILVNQDHQILHVLGGAGRYLEIAEGEPTRHLPQMLRPDLRLEVSAALYAAAAEGREQVRLVRAALLSSPTADRTTPDAAAAAGAGVMLLRVSVRPVTEPEGARGYLLLTLEEVVPASEAAAAPTVEPPVESSGAQEDFLDSPDVTEAPVGTNSLEGTAAAATPAAAAVVSYQLEQEIARLRLHMGAMAGQYEASNEELKASNEELQAMNEELRSTTEELETSKEELQSVNEELATVNHELKARMDEVSRANSDLQNFLSSTDIATLFLDRALHIKRYTPAAEPLFNLIPSDVGRPLVHLNSRLDYPTLPEDAERVLTRLSPVEREVTTLDGEQHFVARLLPYRSLDDRIEGVVINFVDITQRKRVEESKAYLAAIVESSQDSMITINFEHIITSWNRAAEELYGYSASEAIGKPLTMLTLPEDLRQVLDNIEHIRLSEKVEIFDTVRTHQSGREMDLEVVLSPVKDDRGQVIGVSIIARDVTARRKAEAIARASSEAQRASEERFRLLVEGAQNYAMFLLDADKRITFWSAGAVRVFGWSEAEALGQSAEMIFTPEDRAAGAPEQEVKTALSEGSAPDRRWHLRKDGSRFWADGILARLDDQSSDDRSSDDQDRKSSVRGFAKIMRDATQEWKAEEEIRQANEALRASAEELAGANEALARANETLEARVRERTKVLSERSAQVQQLLRELVGVQEQERARISRELHDQLGQHLTGFMLGMDALRAAQPEGSDSAILAERLRQAAADLSGEAHRLAYDLRPPSLDDMGLEAALSTYIAEWQSQHKGIEVDFDSRGADKEHRLPPEVEITFYRIVQEALTNVARHAGEGASSVSIMLDARQKHQVRLNIEDDGEGFDAATVLSSRKRLGLRGMQERAALLGGTMEVESTPGAGTTLFIRVPMNPPDTEEPSSSG